MKLSSETVLKINNQVKLELSTGSPLAKYKFADLLQQEFIRLLRKEIAEFAILAEAKNGNVDYGWSNWIDSKELFALLNSSLEFPK